MKRRSVLLPAFGFLLVLAASCAAGPSGTPDAGSLPEPAVPANPAPAPADPAAVHLPLDPYVRLAAGRQETLDKAGVILTTKCMREKGFDYKTDDAPGGGKAKGDSVPLPAYGINDLAQAKESGYSPPGTGTLQSLGEQGVKLPTLDDAVQKHGAAWVKALYGFAPPENEGSGGCFEASVVHVPEYDKLDKELAGRLAAQAAERAQGDSRVVAVNAAWSACMAESGYAYKSPEEPRKQKWPAPRSSAEIATAVADVTCKQRTNLPGIRFAVESGYQQALLEKNAPALNQLRDTWQLVVKAAEQIVANGG
ncbi:hypothetical protein ACFWY9_40450 [Amycolatopsis sp. NPDC059027]|uniref:hypothetical protein n=1 Tax=unclassified Amycolatopsis TaxID=2618356 RepID=UPI00366F76B9